MKDYIVTLEDRLFLSRAENPKVAIWNIINEFKLDRNEFKNFKARSVGSIMAEMGKCCEFKVKVEE